MPLHLLVKWEVVSPNSRERLNGKWFLQIVERDSWNLYPLYPLFPCSDFVSQSGGGGEVLFFSHFMLYPTFLEK